MNGARGLLIDERCAALLVRIAGAARAYPGHAAALAGLSSALEHMRSVNSRCPGTPAELAECEAMIDQMGAAIDDLTLNTQ